MKLLKYSDPELVTQAVDPSIRKENLTRKKEIQHMLDYKEEALWVYPFQDEPFTPAVVLKVKSTRTGHILATVVTDNDIFDVIIDHLPVKYLSDGEPFPVAEEDTPSHTIIEEEKDEFQEFSRLWEKYIQDWY